jgi:hypothetical protein
MQFPPFSRILPILLFATASTLEAQNGLRDIPDPGVEAQLKAFRLIEGAKINLFASEPAVTSPTNMNWDQQGRLWVVSSPLYPHIQPGKTKKTSSSSSKIPMEMEWQTNTRILPRICTSRRRFCPAMAECM